MSKKANPTLIGVFVVGAVAIMVFAVYFLASQSLFEKKHKFILYFDQSVNGLDIGASVKFKGVDIGIVDEILLHFGEKKAYVPVVIEIQSKELPSENGYGMSLENDKVYKKQIENGLRATLGLQSYLTGKLFIELDYDDDGEKQVFIGLPSQYREIPTVASDLGEIWSAAREMFEKVSEIDFKEVADSIISVAKNFDESLNDFEFKELSDKMIAAFDSFGSLTDKLDEKADPLMDDFRETLAKASDAFGEVERAASSFKDGMGSDDSMFGGQFDETLKDVSDAARSIKNLADYLERNPRALLTGKKLPNS